MARIPVLVSDEEAIELGKELVEWIKKRIASGKPPMHLTEWYMIEKDILYPCWDNLRKRQRFLQYYDSALELMTLATLQNEKLSTAYGSRFLGIYSKDIRDHEKEIRAEKTASLDKALGLVDLKKYLESDKPLQE